MSQYYYIVSKLNGNVLDITGSNTAPRTPIISYPKNPGFTPNQLWERVPTGPRDPSGGQDEFYIHSKLNGNVLDITGANTAPTTPIISYPENPGNTPNQIWKLVFAVEPSYFYIVSKLNGYVIDITGSNTAPRTQIISYPKNPGFTPNQLWHFEPVD